MHYIVNTALDLEKRIYVYCMIAMLLRHNYQISIISNTFKIDLFSFQKVILEKMINIKQLAGIGLSTQLSLKPVNINAT